MGDFTSLEALGLTALETAQISTKCLAMFLMRTKMVWFQLQNAINAVILIITVIINGSPSLRPIGKRPLFLVTKLVTPMVSAFLTTPRTSHLSKVPPSPYKSLHNFPQNNHK